MKIAGSYSFLQNPDMPTVAQHAVYKSFNYDKVRTSFFIKSNSLPASEECIEFLTYHVQKNVSFNLVLLTRVKIQVTTHYAILFIYYAKV